MYFKVRANHVKHQNRKSLYIALLFTIILLSCIALLLNAKTVSDAIFPVIGIFLFALRIFRIYKHVQEGDASYPTLELDEAAKKINVSYKEIVVTVDITKIKTLRLQYKAEHLVSVIVTTLSDEVMRFEGYENIEKLASALEEFTPRDKITSAKLFHR